MLTGGVFYFELLSIKTSLNVHNENDSNGLSLIWHFCARYQID